VERETHPPEHETDATEPRHHAERARRAKRHRIGGLFLVQRGVAPEGRVNNSPTFLLRES
jgi:hypothetical protein